MLETGVWDQTSPDPQLIAAVRQGDASAFGVLFERHADAARLVARRYVRDSSDVEDVVSDAFEKVLGVLQSGGGPDVAFRAYLFTVVRRLAFLLVDRGRRTRPTDEDHVFESAVGPLASVEEPALRGFEDRTVALAFASLPERWQSVLWYTDIEGQAPAAVAPVFGLTANGVAALAYRAREGLRQAYLQQHLQQGVEDGCERANGLLGSFVRGGLSKREATLVEGHLESCGRCRALVLELRDVSESMRGVVAPLVLGLVGIGALAGGLPLAGAVGAGAVAAGSGAAGGAGSGADGGSTASSGSASSGSMSSGSAGAGSLSVAGLGVGAKIVLVAAALVVVGTVAVGAVVWDWFGGPSKQVASGPANPGPDADGVVDPGDSPSPDAPAGPEPEQEDVADAEDPGAPDSDARGEASDLDDGANSWAQRAPVTPTAAPTQPSPAPEQTSAPAPGPTSSSAPSQSPGDPEPSVGPTEPDPEPSPTVDPDPPAVAADLGVTVSGFVALNDSPLRTRVTNTAHSVANDVAVSIDLPDGARFVSSAAGAAGRAGFRIGQLPGARFVAASPAGDWVCDVDGQGRSATCSIPTLAAGASAELVLDVSYSGFGTRETQFPVTVGVGGDRVTRLVTVRIDRAPARVVAQVNADSALVADRHGWLTATVSNRGEVIARDPQVEVVLPGGTRFSQRTDGTVPTSGAGGWECVASTPTTAVCRTSSLPANPGDAPALQEQLNIEVVTVGAAGGPVRTQPKWVGVTGNVETGKVEIVKVEPLGLTTRLGDAGTQPITVVAAPQTPEQLDVTVTNTGSRDLSGLRFTFNGLDEITVTVRPQDAVERLAAGASATVPVTLTPRAGAAMQLGKLELVVAGRPATGPQQQPVTLTDTSRAVRVALPDFAPTKSFEGQVEVAEIGAPLLFCDETDRACRDAIAGNGPNLNNDNHNMKPLNQDPCGTGCGTPAHATSSSAELELPAGARVQYVGLVWSAKTPRDGTGLDEAYIKVPGANEYQQIPAAAVSTTRMDDHYAAHADITDLIKPGGAAGTWSVANIAIAPDSINRKAQYAGWGLIVVYDDPQADPARVDVFTGGRSVPSGKPVTLPFLTTAGTGRIGTIVFEGDRGIARDTLELNGRLLTPLGALRNPANAFDSTATGFAHPNSLGVDAKGFQETPVSTRNELRFNSTQDAYYLGAVTVRTRVGTTN